MGTGGRNSADRVLVQDPQGPGFDLEYYKKQVWQHMPLIPTLGR